MSRSILTKRPPASPNKPPPAPKKLPLKHQSGQTPAIDVKLLVQGNTLVKCADHAELQALERPTSAGEVNVANVTKLCDLPTLDKLRPRSGQLNKHIMKTLSKSPGVDDSYYDKFERSNRDEANRDTTAKERGRRVRSASKQRPRTPVVIHRKRSKSASTSKRKKESFFDLAMSYDNETKMNTKRNSQTNIAKECLGITSKTLRPRSARSGVEGKQRPRSGQIRRDRSVSRSRGRDQCVDNKSDNKSEPSVASGNWCSSRTSRPSMSEEQQQEKVSLRTHSSRSRTRHNEQLASEACTIRKLKQVKDKTQGNSRPTSAKTVQNNTQQYTPRWRSSATSKNIERDLDLAMLSKILDETDISKVPSGRSVPNKQEHLLRKRKGKKYAAIDAVRKANGTEDTLRALQDSARRTSELEETLRQMKEIDKLMYREERRHVTSSTVPKLKMIVAPSVTPLSALVRQSSAKMLIGRSSQLEPKRKTVELR